jgi:hypothetical protein
MGKASDQEAKHVRLASAFRRRWLTAISPHTGLAFEHRFELIRYRSGARWPSKNSRRNCVAIHLKVTHEPEYRQSIMPFAQAVYQQLLLHSDMTRYT